MTTPKVEISDDGHTVYIEPYTFANQEEALAKSTAVAEVVATMLESTTPSVIATTPTEEQGS